MRDDSAGEPYGCYMRYRDFFDSRREVEKMLGVLDSVVDGVAVARVALIVTYRPENQHERGTKSYYEQIRVDAFSPASFFCSA